MRLYDYIGIPLTRFFEGIVQPPIGKNIIVIAGKRSLPLGDPDSGTNAL